MRTPNSQNLITIFKKGDSRPFLCVSSAAQYFSDKLHTHEGLRENIALLGGFQENLTKINIFKIKFLHEKIIFFHLVFSDKI